MVPNRKVPRDVQETLGQFQRDAQEIIDAFVETVTAEKPPDRVSHYTTDAGLKGILESGKLWLTDICGLTIHLS